MLLLEINFNHHLVYNKYVKKSRNISLNLGYTNKLRSPPPSGLDSVMRLTCNLNEWYALKIIIVPSSTWGLAVTTLK
jgi:hypothetical protein